MKKIIITGASGFVGKHFCQTRKERYNIRTVSLQKYQVDDINFEDVDVILHLAGIAHRMEKTDDSLYYDVNYQLTKELGTAAKEAGVQHFIFVSTIKVYGDQYELISPGTTFKPNDAYGKSKLMAEQALKSLETEGFKVSIVRPPLVYGPGVKGNMQKLIGLVERRKFIPLGNINNQRSLVGINNLVALLDRIIEQEKAGEFLIQDAEPVSTSDLLFEIAKSKKETIRLTSIPSFVRVILKLGMPSIYKRLFGSLLVDDHLTKKELNFQPPYSFEEEIRAMVKKTGDE